MGATLGSELRRLREALGLTQEQVANAIGHQKPNRVSLWESDGERGERPSRKNLAKLAPVLQTTLAHLLSFGEHYNPSAPRTTRRQRAVLPQSATEEISGQSENYSPNIAATPQQELRRESEAIVFKSLTLRSLDTVVKLARTVEAHRDIEEDVCSAVERTLARFSRPKAKAARDA